MNYSTALKLITAIKTNIDGDIKYAYDLSVISKYKLTMLGSDGTKRHLTFKLKKEVKRAVYVAFTCEDFRIDFPLIKNVERFTFRMYNFTLMLSYGFKPDNILPNGNLYVEF